MDGIVAFLREAGSSIFELLATVSLPYFYYELALINTIGLVAKVSKPT